MTHNELPSRFVCGLIDRLDLVKLGEALWLLVSEKPGDLRTKAFRVEADAMQAYEEIKQERGL